MIGLGQMRVKSLDALGLVGVLMLASWSHPVEGAEASTWNGAGASGYGVDGLAAIFSLVGPGFENEGFAGAGGGTDEQVLVGLVGSVEDLRLDAVQVLNSGKYLTFRGVFPC